MNFILFTDGASKGNPGPGGWGSIVASDDMVLELGGGLDYTTNNRMELRAVIGGLGAVDVKAAESVVVYTDSSYVINGMTKWVYGWQKNGWKTLANQDVLNSDFWKELLAITQRIPKKIEWKYVGGHVGIAGNERADVIASDFAVKKPVILYHGPRESYSINLDNLGHCPEKSASKTNSRAHAKAKAYSYVSVVDGLVKTHKTWNECESRVRGKKARFKKATSLSEEQSIIREFSK